ncbi:MAG: hypothetical protein AAGC86_07880 [Pseudomonadota bacterium]
MRRVLRLVCVAACAGGAMTLGAPQSMMAQGADGPTYLRLIDRLDRPADGYCLDVLGAGGTYRTDLPVNAHNCKPGTAPDGVVMLGADGTLRFPAFDACLTAFGVNRGALPGSAVLLRPCGATEPFLPTAELQRWDLDGDGRMMLEGSALRLAVGPQSARTFGARDRWRALFLADCATVPATRARWELAPAG